MGIYFSLWISYIDFRAAAIAAKISSKKYLLTYSCHDLDFFIFKIVLFAMYCGFTIMKFDQISAY